MLTRRSPCLRRLGGVAVQVVVVAALSGCGTDLHPGAAATVSGTTITDETVDDLTAAACVYTVTQAKANGTSDGKPSLAIADLKSSLLSSLIAFQLTEEAAAEMKLTPSQAQVDKAAQAQTLPEGMPEGEGVLIEDFFHDVAKNQLQQSLIGAHLSDPSVTTVDMATQQNVDAARDYLDKYFAKADVEVAPSYGRWDGVQLKPGTGSLSDPVSTTAAEPVLPGQENSALESLPPSQVC